MCSSDLSQVLMKKLGIKDFEIVTVGENVLEEPTTVVRIGLL